MRIEISNLQENPTNLLRRAGYFFQRQEGQEMSFVRPLARQGFPRFHLYAKVENFKLVINLHLDQKKNTYGDNTRHHGEYENNQLLSEEVARIKSIIV
ncbi:MAG: hypothetical protein NTZ97_03265 [Candidatus Moranbacteria bacterium]|nr:hypothetical protein [Candidatus Moranbacteria bacterium]